jgi:hypothetical protein
LQTEYGSTPAAARLAGATFFFYIATTISGTVIFVRVIKGEEAAAILAGLAAHASQMRLSFVLAPLTIFRGADT